MRRRVAAGRDSQEKREHEVVDAHGFSTAKR